MEIADTIMPQSSAEEKFSDISIIIQKQKLFTEVTIKPALHSRHFVVQFPNASKRFEFHFKIITDDEKYNNVMISCESLPVLPKKYNLVS